MRIAVVGDVHGNARALSAMLSRLRGQADATVFVGDYVNRGPASAEVLETLIAASSSSPVTCLAGNHDRALLDALDTANITRLLHMGGVPTVLSYVGLVKGDVAARFLQAVPKSHREFLASLADRFTHEGLLVTHEPQVHSEGHEYHVYGHVVQGSLIPLVRKQSAAIDTGCGTLADGRLTALLWPDLAVLQVDPDGKAIENPGPGPI